MKRPILALCLLASLPLAAGQMQVRNAARPAGQRDNQLTGMGLVVGLGGTGDTRQTVFTQQALANLLSNFNIANADSEIKSRNVAVVMVQAQLKPYLKNGDKIDVVVSSIGDAASLAGGTLVRTPLKGADEVVYAVGQGPLSLGEQMGGRLGSLISAKAFRTTARIPSGAIVENEVPATVVGDDYHIRYLLRSPDYTSAARMAMAVNETFEKIKPAYAGIASARDAGSVDVEIPVDYREYTVEFMAALEQVEFEIEERSDRVVVNERTGTVVMGFKVAIDTVAIAHGNLNVNVKATSQMSQPNWFQPGTSALYFNNQNIDVRGGGGSMLAIPETATVADLVTALNSIGATPRDLIAILQAIKEAGALHGDLEIM